MTMTTIDTIRERSGLHRVDAIPGYDGYYVATDEAGKVEVWSTRKGTPHCMKEQERQNGHRSYTLRINGVSRPVRTSRICCLAWHGIPKHGQIAFCIDGFFHRMRPGTVKWMHKANYLRQYFSKLETTDIQAIRRKYSEGAKQSQIAREYDIHHSTVYRIVERQRRSAA